MPRSIDNVDFNAIVHDRSIFGKNRDTTFPFDITRVHDAFRYFFIRAEYVALFEHSVNQGCFTMVNMSNNSNITDILTFHLLSSPTCEQYKTNS